MAKKMLKRAAKKTAKNAAKKSAKKRGPKDRSYVNARQKYETAYEGKRKTPAKKFGAKKVAKKTAKKQSSMKSQLSTEEIGSQLKDLFLDEIKDIYWAEKHLTKALPKMQKAATSPELQDAFATHLTQTEEHVSRLEQVFSLLGEKAQAKKCDAMEGLVEEAKSVIEDTDAGTATRDVGLIIAAQKVEHYEIATYGSLVQLANTLELGKVISILSSTLQEEKATDELLTGIAENDINYKAKAEPAE